MKLVENSIYERIKNADLDEMAEILCYIMTEDTNMCDYCEPSGVWCNDERCINACREWLARVSYKDYV